MQAKAIIENLKNGTEKIVGQRIYLKVMLPENATAEYCGWLNDIEVNKYLATNSINQAEAEDYIKDKLRLGDCLFFGIFLHDKDKHIGTLKLDNIDWQRKFAIFGILIGDKSQWGKGYGTEATQLAINFAFEKLGLNEIELGVSRDNINAIRIYEKVGFKLKEIRKIFQNGITVNQLVMVNFKE